MNNKLLQTKLSSIAHYDEELTKLHEAKEVTESTRKDLVNSLIEFVPFSAGDIITNGSRIMKVATVKSVSKWESSYTLYLEIYNVDYEGTYSLDKKRDASMDFMRMHEWAIVRSDKPQS